MNTIVYNGDLVLDGQTQIDGATLSNNTYSFSNPSTDVGTATDYAKNTVVLRVNGDLTINSGVTLTACASSANYGDPKGLIISSSGTLTNNGSISMAARGAKAKGENIYLYRNKNGTFEYVPAIGATGGASIEMSGFNRSTNGNNGNNGFNRQTGGGGTGSGRAYVNRIKISSGGTGTSYSGGSGGDGAVRSINGSGYGQISLGGTGNPSGSYATYRESVVNYVARHGTGGLLVIDAKTFDNYGTISADGVSSSTSSLSNSNGRVDTGGASGGGSINIFYKRILNRGTITANGGTSITGEGR